MGDDHPAFPMFDVGPGRRSAVLGEAGYKRIPGDAYFTEPWVTRALLAQIDFRLPSGADKWGETIWEPAAGDGRMASVLAAAGYRVIATELQKKWGYGATGRDFLDPEGITYDCAAIVTNPPFGQLAKKFIVRALELTRARQGKVAILQRHEFDAPRTNHSLFAITGGTRLVLPRRPRWVDQVSAGNQKGARFPFTWYIWDWRREPPWITIFCPKDEGQNERLPI